MAEILLEPSSLSKIIPLSFDLNDTNASNAAQLMTKRQFNTADTDAWFEVSLEGFVDTAGSFDITLFNLNDKSVFNHTGKPFTTNPFYYKLDSESDETTNEIRHAGRWIGQIVVTLANGDSATRKFIFDIEGHILDGADVQTILLEDFNTAEQSRTTAFNAAESARAEGYTADHGRAETDHTTAAADHTLAASDHTTALADHSIVQGHNTRLTAEETATANNKISAVKGKTFADVDARFEDVEADTTAMGTNKVTNGDFSNGTTDFAITPGATATSDTTYATTKVKVVSTSTYVGIQQTRAFTDNNLIYASFIGCGNVNAQISTGNAEFANIAMTATPTRYSVVRPWNPVWNDVIGLYNVGIGTNYYGYFIAIDLTATFGAGNEPTAAQMDRLLTQFQNSWFNGTENLFLAKWALAELRRLDNDKANKAQEAWITPTLLNGFTGDVRYRKTETGMLQIVGNLKSPTALGSEVLDIFTLPIPYIPVRFSNSGSGKFEIIEDAFYTFRTAKVVISPYTKTVIMYAGQNSTSWHFNIVTPLD